MKRYNPESPPDPKRWLELEEMDRIELVVTCHERAKEKLPNVKIHAIFHVIVENQLAEGFPETVNAVGRLVAGGLSRHEALHAIGSVVAKHVHGLLKGDVSRWKVNHPYFRDLDDLTVETWISQ